MTQQVSFRTGITLAGGAAFAECDLRAALRLAPHPVAADSGADRLAVFGITPEIVVGDLDSLRGVLPKATRVQHVSEQETTDFGKCLLHVEAPLYIGVGFLGGRLDHTLASMSVMLTHAERRIILIGEEDIAFIAPDDWTMAVEPGARVSFFPLVPCRGAASDGLRWSIAGLTMAAGAQIGTSNEAIKAQISARFEPRGVVTILPKRYLEAAVDSLGQG